MNERITITEEQYRKLLEYLDEVRSKHMNKLYLCIAGSVLLAVPGLMLLFGYGGGRYVALAGLGWIGSLAGTVILLVTGYQKVFGSNAPITHFKQRNYSCGKITISQLSDSAGRPPYLVSDTLGKQYVCPVFLEFKAMRRGGTATSVILPDGTAFAVHDADSSSY